MRKSNKLTPLEVVVIIAVIIIMIMAIVFPYFIATSDLPDWVKFWLLS